MSGRVDHDLVEELLKDKTLSLREIGRRARCSDWTVRRIARELNGDYRPMKSAYAHGAGDGEPRSEIFGWIGLAGTVAVVGLMIWAGLRALPPTET